MDSYQYKDDMDEVEEEWVDEEPTIDEEPWITMNVCPPRRSGIYFLFDGNELVYVGKSHSNMRGRIAAHMADRFKDFTHFGFIELPADEVKAAEDAFILKYFPRYNVALPKGGLKIKEAKRKWHADE